MANEHDSRIIAEIALTADNGRGDLAIGLLWWNRSILVDDAAYWQAVAATWIKCGSTAQLWMWRELFGADRPKRDRLMKKGDRRRWRSLPPRMTAYRAVAPGEPLGVFSYTLAPAVLDRIYKGTREIRAREIRKSDVVAYFTRRKEHEIIVL